MDFGQCLSYAGRRARQSTGDFYPGPRLMPHAVLRMFDPVLAWSFGPASRGEASAVASLEATLRGKPDGPLMLALSAAISSGEIRHNDLRTIAKLFPTPLPDRPQNRGELLSFLLPRSSALSLCLLHIAGCKTEEALSAAERLGAGLALTGLLAQLPFHSKQGKIPLPMEDLRLSGLTEEEYFDAVRTPAMNRLLATETRWALRLLDDGLTLNRHLGARLRRGVRAAVVRARHILHQVDDPHFDVFRRTPQLTKRARWVSAARALSGVKPGPESRP